MSKQSSTGQKVARATSAAVNIARGAAAGGVYGAAFEAAKSFLPELLKLFITLNFRLSSLFLSHSAALSLFYAFAPAFFAFFGRRFVTLPSLYIIHKIFSFFYPKSQLDIYAQ